MPFLIGSIQSEQGTLAADVMFVKYSNSMVRIVSDMAALVSVIAPIYNVEKHLAKSLESITNQTYPHLEIILVDDGSTDGSPTIIREFAERDDRVHAIIQANAGVSAARNAGLEAATGDFVMFVDADDWIEANTLELMMDVIDPDGLALDFASCGYWIDYPYESIVGPPLTQFQGILDTAAGLKSVLGTRQRFAVTRLYRRALIGTTRFREDIHWGEDTIFVIEVALKAQHSAIVHEPLYHYIQSEGSATRSTVNPKRLTGPKMTEILEELVQDDYPQLVDYILKTRLDTLAILIQDAQELPRPESRRLTKQFTKQIRSNFGQIWRAPALAPTTKLKATFISISPMLFIQSRRILTKVRSIRG